MTYDPHPSAHYPGSPSAAMEAEHDRALSLFEDGEMTHAEALAAGCTRAELARIEREIAADLDAEREWTLHTSPAFDTVSYPAENPPEFGPVRVVDPWTSGR